MYVEVIRQLNSPKKEAWQSFLKSAGLTPDDEVLETVLLWEDEQIVGTGSRSGNLLKLIAVRDDRQGEDLTSVILSHLKNGAFSDGYSHLFLYTKPENQKTFESLFFYTVAKTDKVLLMENRRDGIVSFLEGLSACENGGNVGAIVMNANPFTLGHRFLAEQASKQCDKLYVFVVSEDKSLFSAEDRIEMVRQGTFDIKNVTVLPTGPYLISSATFPTYFLKERENANEVQCLLDIEIFVKYFAPRFSINCRFVGTEPLSPMTNEYNKALKIGLLSKGIKVTELKRFEKNGAPVSASRVRELLSKGDNEGAKALLPNTTCEYLKSKGFLK